MSQEIVLKVCNIAAVLSNCLDGVCKIERKLQTSLEVALTQDLSRHGICLKRAARKLSNHKSQILSFTDKV